MDDRKRESMIAYLRRRMAQVGIKVADFAAALAEDRGAAAIGALSQRFWRYVGWQRSYAAMAQASHQRRTVFGAFCCKPLLDIG
jgi:methyl coenzyme M reductase alpha subunit